MATHRRPRVFVRSAVVERMRQKLLSDSFAHAQMALIVLLTGGCGLLASFALLRYGMGSMALRYPLALGLAYLFFLFLIWLWLRTNARDWLDVPDFANAVPGRDCGGAPAMRSGTGGDFAGGGASGDFEMLASSPLLPASPASADSPLSSVGDAVGSVTDADEFAIALLAIALAVGLAFASLYVVYIAPVLFAEVLVDGALSYALFRHLRGQDPTHWLTSTFKRTALPFVIAALFLAGMGAAMSAYAPDAHSVGQFVKQAQRRQGA
jgi:hypothetical protein